MSIRQSIEGLRKKKVALRKDLEGARDLFRRPGLGQRLQQRLLRRREQRRTKIKQRLRPEERYLKT